MRRVRHPGAEGRRRDHAGTGCEARHRDGLSRRPEDRIAADPAQDRGRRCAGRPAHFRRGAQGLRDDRRQCEEVRPQGAAPRRAGPADGGRRPGSHHRRGDRPVVRQARRVRPGRRARRGDEGHHVPPGTGVEGGCAVDAGRHRGGGDPEGRARREGRQSRCARDGDPERLEARRRFPRDRRDGPEPGVRDGQGRNGR